MCTDPFFYRQNTRKDAIGVFLVQGSHTLSKAIYLACGSSEPTIQPCRRNGHGRPVIPAAALFPSSPALQAPLFCPWIGAAGTKPAGHTEIARQLPGPSPHPFASEDWTFPDPFFGATRYQSLGSPGFMNLPLLRSLDRCALSLCRAPRRPYDGSGEGKGLLQQGACSMPSPLSQWCNSFICP